MIRDTLKTLSFAVLHFGVGFAVTYALTGSVAIATSVALIEPAVNTLVFFLHERAWARFERKPRRDRARKDRAGNGRTFQGPTAAHA
jgi:uncharacterized membrane protein